MATPLVPLAGPNAPRFAFLDALRGVGAIAIAVFHLAAYGPLPAAALPELPSLVTFFARNGRYAVEVFFVMAGFVGAYSLAKSPTTFAGLIGFAWRRVLRLGLPYWTVLALVSAMSCVMLYRFGDTSLNEAISVPQVLAIAAFLQDVLGYANLSAGMWFVAVDLQLGLLMAGLHWLVGYLRHGSAQGSLADHCLLSLLYLPLACGSMFLWNLDAANDAYVYKYLYMPMFGAVAYWALSRRVPAWWFWAYAALIVARLEYHGNDPEGVTLEIAKVATTLVTGVVIYLLGTHDALGLLGKARWLQYLGRISYSLFLIHYPVQWAVTSLGYRLTGDQPHWAVAWLAVALAASIVAGDLLYRLVERPSLRRMARRKAEAEAATVYSFRVENAMPSISTSKSGRQTSATA